MADIVGDGSIDPEEAALCARLIARHAVSPGDGDQLADALGLDEGVRTWNGDYSRIMRLADSIPVRQPGQMIAPQLRYRRARATRGRKS